MFIPRGQSILEIIIALGFSAVAILALGRLTAGGANLCQFSRDLARASQLEQAQIEAAYALRLADWRHLFEYSTTTAVFSGGQWQFKGAGQTGQQGKFSYWLEFNPVYRLPDGSLSAPAASGAYLDVLSRQLTAKVQWTDIYQRQHLKQNTIYLTAWPAGSWTQTDWSGGAGQALWQDSHKYWQASSSINTSASGQISLQVSSTTSGLVSGLLVSSAFAAPAGNNFICLSWQQELPETCPQCKVQAQIKTAADNNGQPGEWTSTWCGPEGADNNEADWFTAPAGSLVSTDHNGQVWIKYRLKLIGGQTNSPIVKQVKIYYE